MKNFVIFGLGRSGSHLLGDLLCNLPGVHCDDEIFNPGLWKQWIHGRMLPYFHRHPMRLIAYKRNAAMFQRFALSYGFMLKLNQLNNIQQPPGLLHRLQEADWRIIHLARRSLFAQTVSTFMARRSGRWNSRINEHDAEMGRITIEPYDFVELYKIKQQMNQQCHTVVADLPHLSLTYEYDLQLPEQWQGTICRVCDYLGINAPPSPVRSSVRKTWRKPYNELIENHDELLELAREHGEPL